MTTAAKSPATALKWQKRYFTAPTAQKGLHGLLVRVKRAFQGWSIRRKGRALTASYFRTAEAMGLDPYKDRQPEFQVQKLETVKELAAQLRQLRFPHLNHNSSQTTTR